MLDFSLFIRTVKVRSVRKLLNHLCILPLIPYAYSLFSRCCVGTLSNAFCKSMYITSIFFLCSRPSYHLLRVSISCVTVERLGRKPN
ncbi:unnamed protein product [Meloidogyne enterolobii]|uniref:Uncharacterized protein n=1 Tax=Meloidogyne enterolobii TaxID=390850 RepID=A0ACB0ZW03_MELEN